MAEEPNDSGHRSGRRDWGGYGRLALVLIAILAALYFARAPGRVERGAASGLAPESVRPTVRVIRPRPTEQVLTVESTGTVSLDERAAVASEVPSTRASTCCRNRSCRNATASGWSGTVG